MRLLLDECVNQKLRPLLVGHDVFTVGYLEWSGLRNGALLQAAAEAGFDAVVTTDRAMPTQHNPATLPVTVFVLVPRSDRLIDLVRLVPALQAAVEQLCGRTFVYVHAAAEG